MTGDGRKNVTIKDVAREAGVSVNTTSLAIRGVGYVSKQAREKIEAAVQKLGYFPNLSARKLRNGESRVISVIVGNVNDLSIDKILAIKEFAAANGFLPLSRSRPVNSNAAVSMR